MTRRTRIAFAVVVAALFVGPAGLLLDDDGYAVFAVGFLCGQLAVGVNIVVQAVWHARRLARQQ